MFANKYSVEIAPLPKVEEQQPPQKQEESPQQPASEETPGQPEQKENETAQEQGELYLTLFYSSLYHIDKQEEATPPSEDTEL